MRKFIIALLSACLALPALAITAAPGYTIIMGTQVVDASGAPLASGTATFRVVDASGNPLSVKLGPGGQVITAPVSVPVINGAFTAQVLDVSQSAPSFPCVQLQITNDADGATVWSDNCLQPSGGSYSLDNFSTNTTPVKPEAGDTVSGNLGVTGNLSVTGNLNMGGLTVGNLNSTYVTGQNTNGALNAATFSGSDIGAKVNAAFASATSGGTVQIPAGSYSFSTTMVVPDSVPGTTGFHLDCEPGAVLTYTGSGSAIQLTTTGDAPGGAEVGIDGHGGCQLVSATQGTGVGINVPPSNTTFITGMKILKFGKGIYFAGGNSSQVYNNYISDNGIGIATVTVPGYAPNALHIFANEISDNTWGYQSLNGGVAASHGLGNDIRDNVFEGDTSGDIDSEWDEQLTITGNYFESSGVGILAGSQNNVFNIAIHDNYFTESVGYRSEIELGYVVNAHIYDNFAQHVGQTTTACRINMVTGSGGGSRGIRVDNPWNDISEGTTSYTEYDFCDHAPVVTPPNVPNPTVLTFYSTDDNMAHSITVQGQIHVGDALFSSNIPELAQRFSTMTSTSQIIGEIGSLTIWQGTASPAGTCGFANTFNIWFAPSGMWVCAGQGNWKLVTAS